MFLLAYWLNVSALKYLPYSHPAVNSLNSRYLAAPSEGGWELQGTEEWTPNPPPFAQMPRRSSGERGPTGFWATEWTTTSCHGATKTPLGCL
jgi:hypothetical protein